MSNNNSSLFEDLTKEAIKHGTGGFFRGLLGMIAGMILLSYTPQMPIETHWYLQWLFMAFIAFSAVISGFSMLSAKDNRTQKVEQDEPPALPNLTEQMNEDFARRVREHTKVRRDDQL